ncbi:hypothetical protein [Ferruginibacter profundus]
MKIKPIARIIQVVFFMIILSSVSNAQSCDPLNSAQLKEKLIQLGNTVKDLTTTPGSEKYEVKFTTATFDVPVGFEISPSTNFVWLTVFLGAPRADTSVMNAALLKQNGAIQPCQFYITAKGNLMMGLAVENRGLTNAILKRHSDKIVADVSSTASFWQQK